MQNSSPSFSVLKNRSDASMFPSQDVREEPVKKSNSRMILFPDMSQTFERSNSSNARYQQNRDAKKSQLTKYKETICYDTRVKQVLLKPPCSPLLDVEKRHKELKLIVQLPRYEELRAGNSDAISLWEDYMNAYFRECLLDQTLAEYMKGKIQGEDSLTTTGKDFFFVSKGRIQHLIGNLIYYRDRKRECFNINTPLENMLKPTIERDLNVQKDCINQIEQINVNLQILGLNKSKVGQKLIDALELLRDVIAQEIHILFEPIDSEPDFSTCFKRLSIRLSRLSANLQEFEYFWTKNTSPFKKNKEYKLLFEQDKNILLKYCDTVYKSVLELANSKENTLKLDHLSKLFNFFCQHYRDRYFGHNIGHELVNKLISDNYESKTESSKEAEDLYLTYMSILDMWDYSIVGEAWFMILKSFIEASHISTIELNECIIEVIDVLAALINISPRPIEEQFSALERQSLSENDRIIFKDLKNIWSTYCVLIHDYHTEVVMGTLNKYLMEFENQDSISEKTYIIKYALKSLGFEFPSINKKNRDNLKRYQNACFNSKELEALYDHILYFNELENQTMQSAINSIEALLGRCMDKIASLETMTKAEQTARQEESEKAFNSLLEEKPKGTQKKHKKNKKKVAKKKSTVISQQLPPSDDTIENTAPAQKSLSSEMSSLIQQEPIILDSISPQNNIENIYKAISAIKKLPIDGPDVEFRAQWRNASLSNLKTGLYHLEETINNQNFSFNTIFGETDTIRRILEAILEVVLGHYPVIDENEKSILHQSTKWAHQLHMHVKNIIFNRLTNPSIPENVREVIYAFRSVPYTLSQANACVNYLNSSLEKKHSQLMDLLAKYLKKIDNESNAKSPTVDTRKSLLENHQIRIKKAIFFVSELLKAVANPEYRLDRSIIPKENMAFSVEMQEDFTSDFLTFSNEEESEIAKRLIKNIQQTTAKDIIKRQIRNREEALAVIDEVILWIRIRMMSPAEKGLNVNDRTKQRNQALENVRLYMQRLREKLISKQMLLYDTCCEELLLLRRAHKELSIGALYHSSYYKGKVHVVEKEKLRHLNNPCFLNKILHSFSSFSVHLPNLFDPSFIWMQHAHQVLSYPSPLRAENSHGFDTTILLELVQKVRVLAKQNRKISAEKNQEEITKLVMLEEEQKVFPALGALLQILRYGIPLPRSVMSIES